MAGPIRSVPAPDPAGRRSRAVRPMAPLLDDDEPPAALDDEAAIRRKKVKAGEDYFDDAEKIAEEDADEVE